MGRSTVGREQQWVGARSGGNRSKQFHAPAHTHVCARACMHICTCVAVWCEEVCRRPEVVAEEQRICEAVGPSAIQQTSLGWLPRKELRRVITESKKKQYKKKDSVSIKPGVSGKCHITSARPISFGGLLCDHRNTVIFICVDRFCRGATRRTNELSRRRIYLGEYKCGLSCQAKWLPAATRSRHRSRTSTSSSTFSTPFFFTFF